MNRELKLLLVLLLATFGLAGCSTRQSRPASSPETVRNISVLAVQQTGVPDLLEAVGTVRAAQTSDAASQMTGNIVEIRAHEGDRVQRGQVLAVIDDSQPRAAVDRATAADLAAQQELVATDSDLALAESTFRRYQTLFERKSVSPQEFDEMTARQQTARARRDIAKAGQAQAHAALSQARTSFDYTRIRAPFDGLVTERKADAGTLASPGMPLFTIEDVRHYRLEVTVNESDLQYARKGERVPVVIDALKDNAPNSGDMRGTVAQIVPAADPASGTFLVKIELSANTQLRSGLFGRARFSRGERQVLLIPRSAVIERGQLQGIYVLDQNEIASLRYISLGKPSGLRVEVLAGLQDGERFVATPGAVDLSGKRIEVR